MSRMRPMPLRFIAQGQLLGCERLAQAALDFGDQCLRILLHDALDPKIYKRIVP